MNWIFAVYCGIFRIKPQFKMATSVNRLVFTYFLLIFMYGVHSQTTFSNSCECEYVNGQCAYTLMLPLSGNNLHSATCAGNNNGAKVADEIINVKTNLSSVSRRVTMNTQMISQLQAIVINIQNMTSHFYYHDDDPTSEPEPESEGTPEPENDNNNDHHDDHDHHIDPNDFQAIANIVQDQLQEIPDLQNRVTSLETNASELNTLLHQLQREFSILQTSFESMGTDNTELIQTLQHQQQKMGSLERRLNDLYARDVDLCAKKGNLFFGEHNDSSVGGVNVSSIYDMDHGVDKVDLFNTDTPGSWCPGEPNSDYEWVQFDLGSQRVVYGIVTRGRHDYTQWVTSYKIQYANEEMFLSDDWMTFKDQIDMEQVFMGNTDQATPKINMLWQPISARYIRIVPITGHQGFNMCLRADIIGCRDS